MLTRTSVALATATVLAALGAASLVFGPGSGGPVERPAVMTQKPLWIPVVGVGVDKLVDSWGAPRSGGRKHKGIDIFAPQGTEVRAAAAGTIVGRYLVGKGGIALYQLDESGKLVYYYAHLNGFASDLKKGMKVSQGQVIGYVGTTGNAEKTSPHLHFQIQAVAPGQPWWQAPAMNPYPALMAGQVDEAVRMAVLAQPPAAGKSPASHLASMMTGSTKSVRPTKGTKRGTRTYQP